MKALILSAGLGTRLLPLTELVPKPLVPICNMPLLDIIIRQLKEAGITSCGINLHHLPGTIREHLGKREDRDSFFFTHEPVILGTGGGIAGFAGYLEDQECFFVHNCDILSTIDIEGAIAFHRRERSSATLVLVEHGPTNSITILPDGTIRDIWGKLGRGGEGRTLTFSGLAVYDRSILNSLPQGTFYSIIDVLLEKLRQGDQSMRGFVQDRKDLYWRDVGSVASYLDIHRDILERRIFTPAGLVVPGDSRLMGEGVAAGEGVTMEGFLSIGDHAVIGEGARLRDTVVWPRTAVPPHSEASRKIFADHLLVEA